MAKTDTISDIKAANGQDVPDSLTQKQLDELLPLAQKGEEGLTDFQAKLTEFTGGSTSTAPKTSGEKQIKVRVNAAIAAYGGEFTDPDSRAVIGKDAVSVPHTAFVREKLRSEELVEAG
ncbi:hypothetical protein [Deinococcus sp. NW-56]|uniref:hypothetical protein n=1 Tax=Deinococcus sp. NW-56 TaxID=2080419 RepID=UPI000CF4C319|nr:hypothetical protein [Deinococcus sp. NW-56]